jgi:hypothetical protein
MTYDEMALEKKILWLRFFSLEIQQFQFLSETLEKGCVHG